MPSRSHPIPQKILTGSTGRVSFCGVGRQNTKLYRQKICSITLLLLQFCRLRQYLNASVSLSKHIHTKHFKFKSCHHHPSRQNCGKSSAEECIFDYMASHIEYLFNKNSLLQCYFLAILPAGILFLFRICKDTCGQHTTLERRYMDVEMRF